MGKRLLVVLILVGSLAPGHVEAQVSASCGSPNIVPINKETLTVSTTATGLTASSYSGAIGALITVASADARMWFDGSTPTASVGHLIASGQSLTVCGVTIRQLKVIRAGASDTVLSVTYLGVPQS